MKPFLQRLGVSENELSPFCREFDNVTDLLGEYNDYYSRTKKSTAKERTTGDGDDEDEVVDAEDDDCEDDEMQCRASVPDCMSHAESASNMALERADAADDEAVTM